MSFSLLEPNCSRDTTRVSRFCYTSGSPSFRVNVATCGVLVLPVYVRSNHITPNEVPWRTSERSFQRGQQNLPEKSRPSSEHLVRLKNTPRSTAPAKRLISKAQLDKHWLDSSLCLACRSSRSLGRVAPKLIALGGASFPLTVVMRVSVGRGIEEDQPTSSTVAPTDLQPFGLYPVGLPIITATLGHHFCEYG